MATQTPSSSTSEHSKKRKIDNSSCSEEEEKIITSSPTSSSTPRWKYEVFLSFHGEDTRKSFTDHLYFDLKRKGILVFRDDEALQRGEYISQALLKAIQESQYAIVVFSANYAFSKWCLMELSEIVEWEEKKKLTVLPIFYHVDPSDVRNQNGSFAEAFTAYEKDPQIDKKDMDMWKNACIKVGNLAGEHIKGDRYESTIIQEISGRISHELNSRFLRHDYDKFVAIDSHVDKMMELLDMESDDVRFVGIHGMGGVGKTTLAEIIYDRVSSNCRFEGSSFISCIREESKTRGLAALQKQLLSMIIKEKIHVWDHHNGSKVISRRFRDKKVFIVLDDVDSDEQLTALVEDRKWFGPGSRVIITCRDSHLLRTHEVNDIYKVEQLETAKALQLFSLSAFKKTHPIENYMDLSMDFVNYAQGLPLALKVLGSLLYEREIDAWKSEKDKLKAIPNPKIMDVLQISFDGLQELQKDLFLDMACLSQRQHVVDNIFCDMLESFGHYSIDIDILIEKSLISKSKYGWLSMHDLLKEMGQEIVRLECPEEPGRRSRLFGHEDVFRVLKNDTGTDAIRGIVMDFCPETKEIKLNAKALSKMKKLGYLKFHHSPTIEWDGDPLKYLPTNALRFLKWSECPSRSWPSNFQPKNLIVLNLNGSRFKRLWKGLAVLPNLKSLVLSFCENLIETPNLSGAPNLEEIIFSQCINLSKIHPSIGLLKRLQKIRMFDTKIKQLRKGTLKALDNLKYLHLNNSKNLIETLDLSGAPNLEIIDFSSCTNLCKVHPSIKVLKRLQKIRMLETGIKQLWKGLVVLDNLKSLDLYFCKNLIETPDLSGAPNLEEIILSGCTNLCKVHPSIKEIKRLQKIIMPITGIKQLWKGLAVLDNLKYLDLSASENLIETPDLSGAPNLEQIDFSYCKNLCEVHPSIGVLKRLQEIRMRDTGIKQL